MCLVVDSRGVQDYFYVQKKMKIKWRRKERPTSRKYVAAKHEFRYSKFNGAETRIVNVHCQQSSAMSNRNLH